MADGIEKTTTDLLRAAYAPSGGVEGADDPAYKAQLSLYARTQYGFYVGFQALVAALAIAVAAALLIAIMRLVNDADVAGVITGLAAVVAGGATIFLQQQASQAKDRYLEAMTLLKQA